MPALVVPSAAKPSLASITALPQSQAQGSTKPRCARCIASKAAPRSTEDDMALLHWVADAPIVGASWASVQLIILLRSICLAHTYIAHGFIRARDLPGGAPSRWRVDRGRR